MENYVENVNTFVYFVSVVLMFSLVVDLFVILYNLLFCFVFDCCVFCLSVLLFVIICLF